MSVELKGGVIVLSGRCTVEEAETLMTALLEHPGLVLDLTGVQKLHTAVLQIILALRPPVRGNPTDPLLRELVCAGAVSE